jgi:hypothetical protein
MHRCMSLPPSYAQTWQDYLLRDDRLNSNDHLRVARPPVLRHSWYKAVAHGFTNDEQIHSKLHEVRLRELELIMKHKVDYALLLKEYIVPLQASLDLILDSSGSFDFKNTTARDSDHMCEGPFIRPSR